MTNVGSRAACHGLDVHVSPHQLYVMSPHRLYVMIWMVNLSRMRAAVEGVPEVPFGIRWLDKCV